MESGMIVIAAVLVAVIVVPILLISINTKKQSKTLLNGLKTLCSQNNGVLSEHIEHNNFALGADENKKAIYFYKKTEDAIIAKTIHLKAVDHCEILKTTTRVKKEKGFEELTQKVTISFIPIKGESTEFIDLYDDNDSLLVNGEVAIAEDWKRIVNQLIAAKSGILNNIEQKFKVAIS
jgi:hypothetical protein